MADLVLQIKNACAQAISAAFSEIDLLEAAQYAEIAPTVHADFGHYQCNGAMRMAKVCKKAPIQIAGLIQEQMILSLEDSIFEKVKVAPPGFINMTLKSSFLASFAEAMLSDFRLLVKPVEEAQKVIVEFSSPNTAKQLHVGHLRSTIIGDCLARLFEFLGYDVVRLNHVGDWGTAFGMLIAYLQVQEPGKLKDLEACSLEELVDFYKAAKELFDRDPSFKKVAQQRVVALQSGKTEAVEVWKSITEVSRKAYEEIYRLLDVRLVERGESYYNPMLQPLIQDLEQKGLIQISEGAKCLFLEGFIGRDHQALPMIVQKSDGGFNYDTTDLAAMRHRIQEEKAQRIIIVTDAGQKLHFDMLRQAAIDAGYLDESLVEFNHVTFGLVLGEDGKKLKTRSGDTPPLRDLLMKAIQHAKTMLLSRAEESGGKTVDMKLLDTTAQALGIAAIKYADLSTHRMSDYTFSYERMLKFEGNTACFLMYSYVRILSIQRTAAIHGETKKIDGIEHPSEVALILHLIRFPELIEGMAKDLLPHRLTDYLYELANRFNAFFRDCRVVGDPREKTRLAICSLIQRVFERGFYILGIQPISFM